MVTPQAGGFHHLSSSSSPFLNGKRLRSRGHPRSDLSISTLLPSLSLSFEIPHSIPIDSNPNLSVTVSPTLINGSSTLKPLAVILPLNDNENHLESVTISIRLLFFAKKKMDNKITCRNNEMTGKKRPKRRERPSSLTYRILLCQKTGNCERLIRRN